MELSPDFIPDEFRSGAIAAAEAIGKLDRVLIAGHINPDGDAVGAMAAAGFILNHLGKDFVLYSPTGVPSYLDFLELPGFIYTSFAVLPFKPDSAIYVDCSEPSRLGKPLEEVWDQWPSVNIDHHVCDGGLGSLVNYITPAAAATCQLMAYVSIALGIPLRGSLADAIALGVLTDTGNFSHDNTTAAIFRLCAALEENGCRLSGIGEDLRSNWTLQKLRLWGYLFNRARHSHRGRVVWSVIYEEDLKLYDCRADDLEGYIDWLRRIREVDIAFTVRQVRSREKSFCKFSLRSRQNVDVQTIAASLGGGGHKNAAGGSIDASPPRALAEILSAIDDYLKKSLY